MDDIPPHLCTRYVKSLWLERSLQDEVMCWRDRLAHRGGDSLVGGAVGETAPII